jgi:hypothetical protein
VTVRRMREASLGVAGALVAGLVLAPSGGASAAGSDGPDFYSVAAVAVAPTDGAARVAAAKGLSSSDAGRQLAKSPKVAKSLQILQQMTGTNSIGNQGLSVAAGPRHVMQVGGDRTRVLNKRTGGIVNTKQLGQAIGVTGATQGTVVYDPLARRWFLAAVTDEGGDVGLVLRVSKGTKPTKWQPAVTFASAGTGDSNSDVTESRPAIGSSSDKVVITTLADDPDAPANVNRIFVFPKQPLMNGNAPSPWVADLNQTYDGQRPAVNASTQSNIFVAIPDTNDVTVTTYTGSATTSAPNFSKNVVYPTRGALTPAPAIDQGAGDDLDLGPLAFSGVSWRGGKLFAAASGTCDGDACIRLIGVGTEAGVTLIEDEKITNPLVGNEVFSPSVAIDGNGYVHMGATAVNSGTGGPSLAALALTKVNLAQPAGGDLKARFVKQSSAVFDNDGAPGTVDWYNSTGAAIDPTSPWDVWVTGAIGSSSASNPNLETSIARVSMARGVVTVKSSSNRVRKGSKATLTITVTRPQSKDTIAGQGVNLQQRPAAGGAWKRVGKGTTDASGSFSKRIKITKNVQFRGVLRKVQQVAGEGVAYDRVNSKAITVRLR